MFVTAQYPFTYNKRNNVTSNTSLHQTHTYYFPPVVKRSLTEKPAAQAATELKNLLQ